MAITYKWQAGSMEYALMSEENVRHVCIVVYFDPHFSSFLTVISRHRDCARMWNLRNETRNRCFIHSYVIPNIHCLLMTWRHKIIRYLREICSIGEVLSIGEKYNLPSSILKLHATHWILEIVSHFPHADNGYHGYQAECHVIRYYWWHYTVLIQQKFPLSPFVLLSYTRKNLRRWNLC